MRVWEGRFKERETVTVLEKINSSIELDALLAEEEITASIAYANSLHICGSINEAEFEKICEGLKNVFEQIQGGLDLSEFEDIHSAVELLLIRKVGGVGGKLHTGRSRNEQVVTDERLYIKKKIGEIEKIIQRIQQSIMEIAKMNVDVVMPGYTHLQQGQCVTFGHYIMQLFWQLERGSERLNDAMKRIDVCVLGSGALAGSTVPIDREKLARQLGMAKISENSMDAVTDRSYITEVLFILHLILLDVSRFSEDMIIYCSREFGFISMDDTITTSSSLMPQKKNPDIFELLRQSPGKLWGHISNLVLTCKGIPSTYNKDLQEDKGPLMQGLAEAGQALSALAEAIIRIEPNTEKMKASIDDFIYATDMADKLVEKGIPFREAHEIIASWVAMSEKLNRGLSDWNENELSELNAMLTFDMIEELSPEASVRMKKTVGSTHPMQVKIQIEKAKDILIRKMKAVIHI